MNRFQLRPLIFSLCLIMAMGSTYVMAQEEEAEAPQIKEERKSLIEMERYTGDLLSGLTPDQAQYLYEIRVNFGNIYSVGVATQQVEDAVKACTKNNPDLKEPMQTRYKEWSGAITEEKNTADKALKDAIKRQPFRPAARVNTLLKKVDAAFKERDGLVERVPVSSAEACQHLLASMDDTQEQMVGFMQETTTALDALSIEPKEPETQEPSEPQDAAPQE